MAASLTHGLENFDLQSLREGVAALLLWPKNADRHAALEELGRALAQEPTRQPGRPIEAADWAEWLASRQATPLQEVHPDGIHDAPLAVEASLLGRNRALLGGHLEFPDLHYRLWAEALVGVDDPELQASLRLLTATSSLCDLVESEAGLGGYRWPDHEGAGTPVRAPDQEEYERLRAALRLKIEDPGVAEVIDPLARGADSAPWQPLIRTSGSTFVVVEPWMLSLSGLVRAVDLAARSPRFSEVLDRLASLSLETAVRAAEEMGWKIDRIEEGHILARPDLDCLVLIAIGVIPLDSDQFATETLTADRYLQNRYEETAAVGRAVGADHSLLALLGDGRGVALQSQHPFLNAKQTPDPWLLGVGELQLIGEALRDDPLGLPAALEWIPRPPWAENFDLLDGVGGVRQLEENHPEGFLDPEDATDYMYIWARAKAGRHPALLPDASCWVEVSRWEFAGAANIFRSYASNRFLLLVRAPGRFLWVTCESTFEERFELLPTLAFALAFWLDRLCRAGFLLGHSLSGQVLIRFRLDLDLRPGPQLAIGHEEGGIRLIAGSGFVRTLCEGDNESDRMLVGAVLAWAAAAGAPAPDDFLDEVLPPGRATLVVWPEPEAGSNEPLLDPPRPVEPRARRQVELELAAAEVEPTEIVVISDEGLEFALEDLARTLESGIQKLLDSLRPGALLDLLVLHERLAFQSMNDAILLPALSEVGGFPVAADEPYRELAMRVLIERAAALPPAGTKPLSLKRVNWLRAATELQLRLRASLDSVRFEGAGGRIVISTMLGIQCTLGGALPDATQALFDQVVAAAPDRMALQHEAWWGGEPVIAPDPVLDDPVALPEDWGRVDAALREEWGVSLEQTARLLAALREMAEKRPQCSMSMLPEPLRKELTERTRIAPDVVAVTLERLTLGPCPEFDSFEEAHQPGRPNRERSYLRRPLVRLPNDELAWSALHCTKAAEYLLGLIASGRLRGGDLLTKSVGRFSQKLDLEFEETVLEAVQNQNWEGELRVEELDGKRLELKRGQSIGDIDVLAWSPRRREVWLLDAKRLSPGVEPGRMLLEGSDFENYVKKHERRLRWVRDHLPELGKTIGAEAIEKWQVRAALVLDRPLAGAHLREWPLPIWTLWSLPRELNPPPDSTESPAVPQ